jgi:hypothetical protein
LNGGNQNKKSRYSHGKEVCTNLDGLIDYI